MQIQNNVAWHDNVKTRLDNAGVYIQGAGFYTATCAGSHTGWKLGVAGVRSDGSRQYVFNFSQHLLQVSTFQDFL